MISMIRRTPQRERPRPTRLGEAKKQSKNTTDEAEKCRDNGDINVIPSGRKIPDIKTVSDKCGPFIIVFEGAVEKRRGQVEQGPEDFHRAVRTKLSMKSKK